MKPEKFRNKYETFRVCANSNNKNEYFIDLGHNLIMRSLRKDDFRKNYLNLLSQLTVVGNVTEDQFEIRYNSMKTCCNTYYILVVEDLSNKLICASLTHVYEQKFLRNASARGRIEDVVVDENYRGKKLSKILLDVAVQISELLGCYKLSLECKDDLLKLYKQFGFDLEQNQNYLCQRFKFNIQSKI